MSKSAPYVCQACGTPSHRWSGKCTRCGEFGSVTETTTSTNSKAQAHKISEVSSDSPHYLPTGLVEFDRVLGGGLVSGQVVLIAGEPGVGKSTLMLSAAHEFSTAGYTSLYVTGEESVTQLGVRAQRIGARAQDLLVSDNATLDALVGLIDTHQPDLLIIDSIQTMTDSQLEGRSGGIAQVHAVTQAVTTLAKNTGMRVLLIGQSTRENSIAGPRAIEHLVDTVLTFEGDAHSSLRLLRTAKNRYGAADEVACFEQTPSGIQEIPDPSSVYRSQRDSPVSGTASSVILAGRRPLIAEVQSLVARSRNPRRIVSGMDTSRAGMLIAVASDASLSPEYLMQCDVYLATVGGAKIDDPAADLALVSALFSATTQRPLPLDVISIGEVALSGDIRRVPMLNERLAEAARLGFRRAIVGAGNGHKLQTPPGMTVHCLSNVGQVFDYYRQVAETPQGSVTVSLARGDVVDEAPFDDPLMTHCDSLLSADRNWAATSS